MADNITKQFNLNTSLRLEYILASLKSNDYKTRLDALSAVLQEYDKSLLPIIDKYIWIVEKQLNGQTPTIDILRAEFETLNFEGVVPISDPTALSQYITMFVSQKKRAFNSNYLLYLSDKIRTQGISDKDTADLYRYLDASVADRGYEPISHNYKELYEQQKDLVGISFLCDDLDNLTGGIMPGSVCTILGAPGSMKTTYSSNIAYGAIKSGKNVLYLSLEEPSMQLYGKWLSRCSVDAKCPIPQKDIIQRLLDDKQSDNLFNRVMPMMEGFGGRLYIVDEQNLPDYNLSTLESIFMEVESLAKEETGHGIDLLVVDHIQLIKFAISGDDTNTTINRYVTFFRKQSLNWLHEERQIAVILLSQANREGYAYAQKNDGQYLKQHVAEASEVERASSYIISVYTDAMSQITNQLTLCAVKLRNSIMPASVMKVFADGSVYQVGLSTVTQGATADNSVNASTLDFSSII